MKIEHIAIWTKDIERLKKFYIKYFDLKCNNKYVNAKKEFQSYFLPFDEGARIEIMQIPDLVFAEGNSNKIVGVAHFAVSVGSREAVDKLTDKLYKDGHKVLSQPRTTGDGYYESLIEDIDGNRVEITI